MATRKDIQIAQDLIRFLNIMNDLMDCASYILREIDPQTGGPYQVLDGAGGMRPATLEEIKQEVKRIGQNAIGYWNMMRTFVDLYGAQKTKTALQSLGMNVIEFQADLESIRTEAAHIRDTVINATTKADLLPYADHVDANVPKLVLVRRSWCLGL